MNDKETVVCPHCGESVSAVDRFCRHCGHPLAEPSGSLEEEGDRLIEKLRNEERRIEADIRIEAQEKIKRWLTVSGSLVGIILAGLVFFGFKETFDIHRYVESTKEDLNETKDYLVDVKAEAEQLMTEMKQAAESAELSIEKQAQKLRGLIDESEKKFELLDTNIETVKSRSDAVEDLVNSARDLNTKLNQLDHELKVQFNEIREVRHSLFPITLHFDAASRDTPRRTILEELEQSLSNRGFILSPESVFDTEVERTEIVYYEENSLPQAQFVLDALLEARRELVNDDVLNSDSLGSHEIDSRFLRGFNRRDIVIKLKIQD